MSWYENHELVENGIKTDRGYGNFTYDFANYREITIVYTFKSTRRTNWTALLNLGHKPNNQTYGIKVENNANNGVQFEGVNNASDNKAIVIIDGGVSETAVPIELNRAYCVILRVSLIKGVDVFSNGTHMVNLTQPMDRKGFNANGLTGLNDNSFNKRISNQDRNLGTIHHSLRVWDIALSDLDIMREFQKDQKDYNITV